MMRSVTEADTSAILAITAGTNSFKPMEIETLAEVLSDYHEGFEAMDHSAYVWEEDGRISGFVYFAPEEMTDRTWCLWWIVVAANQQRRGLGAKLLEFVESSIREQDGRLLVVETADTERYEPTRRFYEKHGYTAAAHIPDYYFDDDGMIMFTKRLSPRAAGSEGRVGS